MTTIQNPYVAGANAYRLALRACRFAFTLVAVGAVAAYAARAAIGEGFAQVPLGIGLAVVTGGLATLLHARALQTPAAVPALARQSLQIAIAGGFLLQLVGLGAGVALLFVAGVKFPGLAAFALSFAGAALVFQVAAAASIARGLRSSTEACRT